MDFDPRWTDDSRDRDDRGRLRPEASAEGRELSQGSRGGSSDSRERGAVDPRDVFTKDLSLPRGSERERVRVREHEVRLRGSESRTLATVGAFHVIGKFRKERDVPMQPDAHAALKEQLEEEDKLWKQNPQRLREVLAEGATRAKIPTITPHALRHTFGTRWLQAGGDIYKLSKILGHSSVAVTESHYAHLLKEDVVAASQQVKIPVAPRPGDNVVKLRPQPGAV